MPLYKDRVLESTTTTGIGTINLGGARIGYQSFSQAFSTGNIVYYCISGGSEWEIGYGTLTTGTPWTLSRTTVVSSSNANAAVPFSAGTKDVFSTIPTVNFVTFDSSGVLNVSGNISSTTSGFIPGVAGDWQKAALKATGAYGGGVAWVDGAAGFGAWAQSSGAQWCLGYGTTSGTLTTGLMLTNTGAVTLSGTLLTGEITAKAAGGEGGQINFQSVAGGTGSMIDIDTANNLRIYNSLATNTILYTNSLERIRINSAGNVGVAATPSLWAGSVINSLDVGNSSISSNTSNTVTYISANTYYNGTSWIAKNTAAANILRLDSGSLNYQVAPSVTAGLAQSFVTKFFVDGTTAFVAIGGHTNPQVSLDILYGTANTAGDPISAGVVNIVGPNCPTAVNYGNLNISTNDASALGVGGSISFGGRWAGTEQAKWAFIRSEPSGVGEYGGSLVFGSRTNGAGSSVERLRITPTGALRFANMVTTDDHIQLYGAGAVTGYGLGVEGSTLYYRTYSNHRWYFNSIANGGTAGVGMQLSGNNLAVSGTVSCTNLIGGLSSSRSIDSSNGTANVNNATASGFYYGTNVTGMPDNGWWVWQNNGAGWGNTFSDGYGWQQTASFWSDDFRIRRFQTGVWQPWASLLHSGNVGTYAMPIAGGIMTGLLVTKYNSATLVHESNDTSFSVRGDTTHAAAMSFHRGGAYAINMGLDTDNVFKLGGWSDGAVFRWTSDGSGNFVARGNITAYSDEKLKTNWSELPHTFLYDLAKVKAGTYDRLDNNIRQIGVSAQSLQTVIPEAVIEDSTGILSVAYGNAALVACVELAKEIKILKEEIRLLKERK